MTNRIRLAALAIALAVGPAVASSPDAWAEFDARVEKACLAASGLRNARPSRIVGFDDRVGVVAMLVSDRTRGSARAVLCLYDKKTRKAHVDDAEMWSAPPSGR
ncbi:hypothetical protein [Aureimonas sp. ME7]|uniref:hypothetical protein n=1 Tax=Aureimonas sp. ME7 TaxID=2744252 RepID=UPI0015F671C2|nr:hypothetical protein [Aureimonas sp. ME7]